MPVVPLAARATNESRVDLASYASLETVAAMFDPVAAQATDTYPDSRITLYVGSRNLDDTDWYPVDQQLAFMLEYVRETADAPLGFEIGFGFSNEDKNVSGVPVDGETFEVYGGGHKTWMREATWHPYAGFGLAWLRGE